MNATLQPIRNLIASARPRRLRTFAEFAEAEITLARGPREGLKFRRDFAPWTGPVLAEFDNPHWSRRFGVGPVQSGKTLVFYVIPACYHLFEIGETVIIAAPKMEIAQRRYDVDILPVIKQTRYASLLPVRGHGSRGGRANDILFGNGARLIFMSGAGSDANRSSETSRVVLVTEADKMDEPGDTSRETAPVLQLEARTSAYGENAVFYGECTVSIEKGYIYQQVREQGSGARIHVRCPHCGRFVYPERSNLSGVEGAEDEQCARDAARIACPACAALWTEDDRKRALVDVRLSHKGQEIAPDGSVSGPLPRTRTLGIEWNWLASPMTPLTQIGALEWNAARSPTDNEQKSLLQFRWVVPWKEQEKPVELSYPFLAKHAGDYTFDPLRALSAADTPRAALPAGPEFYVGTVDVQKRWLYIALDGFDRAFTRWCVIWHVVEIVPEGATDNPTDEHLRRALDESRRILMDVYGAASMWVDCGYRFEGFQDHVVKSWCHEQGSGVNGLVGRSTGQQARMTGKAQDLPAGVPTEIIQARLQDDGSILWFLDVDKLKDDVHARLFRSMDSPGCHWFAREAANPERTSRSTGAGAHGWIFRHYMAAKQVFETRAGRRVRRWHETGHHDLWDLAAYGLAGAYVTQAHLQEAQQEQTAAPVEITSSSGIRTRY